MNDEDKVISIYAQIEQLLPQDQIIMDFQRALLSTQDQVLIELEKRTIVVDKNVQVDVIAYVVQRGLIGESSGLRVTIGLGGIKYVSGINVPNLCWVTLHYTESLLVNSMDFYEQMKI